MNTIFTDEDRLTLLQLMTKRSMMERQNRRILREESDVEADVNTVVDVAPQDLPALWRFLQEGTTLYDWQKECLPLWASQGRGTVKVATGGGKTLFALAAAQKLQNEREPDLKLVVVVPTIPLLFQWHDEIRRGNLPESTIGLMGGGQELPPASQVRVLICVLNSAREKLPGFVSKAQWADKMLLVVDECHRANAEQARQIFGTNPRYTLGLSATPEQDAECEGLPTDESYEKGIVGQSLGPIIYDFTIKQSLDAGLLTPFEVWHVGLPLSPDEANEHGRLSREISELRKDLQKRYRKSQSKQGFIAWCQTQASRRGHSAADAERFIGLANRRKRLLYKAKARSVVTLGALSESLADAEGRAIVFHESIEGIEFLFLEAVDMRLPAVLEHSQLPDSLRAENIEVFRKGTARVIISAKSLVEGFNVPSADLGIIAASSGSVRQRIQSLGRMLRRKKEGRTAHIIVLYVRDTEDEAIYEKADWEDIVGAERNRYFTWSLNPAGHSWTNGLEEMAQPPRPYKPSSWEIDISDLKLGEPYRAQPGGVELKVDQSGNLRLEDSTLVPASLELIDAILDRNPYRQARRTPAGHLIVRVDPQGSNEPDWRFLGRIDLPAEGTSEFTTKFRIKTISGRRVIVLDEGKKRGTVRFALGPDKSSLLESGQARDRLLEWIRTVESERGSVVYEILWNNENNYWIEISGERIQYPEPLAPLEFAK